MPPRVDDAVPKTRIWWLQDRYLTQLRRQCLCRGPNTARRASSPRPSQRALYCIAMVCWGGQRAVCCCTSVHAGRCARRPSG